MSRSQQTAVPPELLQFGPANYSSLFTLTTMSSCFDELSRYASPWSDHWYPDLSKVCNKLLLCALQISPWALALECHTAPVCLRGLTSLLCNHAYEYIAMHPLHMSLGCMRVGTAELPEISFSTSC